MKKATYPNRAPIIASPTPHAREHGWGRRRPAGGYGGWFPHPGRGGRGIEWDAGQNERMDGDEMGSPGGGLGYVGRYVLVCDEHSEESCFGHFAVKPKTPCTAYLHTHTYQVPVPSPRPTCRTARGERDDKLCVNGSWQAALGLISSPCRYAGGKGGEAGTAWKRSCVRRVWCGFWGGLFPGTCVCM